MRKILHLALGLIFSISPFFVTVTPAKADSEIPYIYDDFASMPYSKDGQCVADKQNSFSLGPFPINISFGFLGTYQAKIPALACEKAAALEGMEIIASGDYPYTYPRNHDKVDIHERECTYGYGLDMGPEANFVMNRSVLNADACQIFRDLKTGDFAPKDQPKKPAEGQEEQLPLEKERNYLNDQITSYCTGISETNDGDAECKEAGWACVNTAISYYQTENKGKTSLTEEEQKKIYFDCTKKGLEAASAKIETSGEYTVNVEMDEGIRQITVVFPGEPECIVSKNESVVWRGGSSDASCKYVKNVNGFTASATANREGQIKIGAFLKDGYVFDKWDSDCEYVGNAWIQCSIDKKAPNITVKAITKTYTLTAVIKGDGGSIQEVNAPNSGCGIDCGKGNFTRRVIWDPEKTNEIRLVATAKEGYKFQEWLIVNSPKDTQCEKGSTSETCTLIVKGNTEVWAMFGPKQEAVKKPPVPVAPVAQPAAPPVGEKVEKKGDPSVVTSIDFNINGNTQNLPVANNTINIPNVYLNTGPNHVLIVKKNYKGEVIGDPVDFVIERKPDWKKESGELDRSKIYETCNKRKMTANDLCEELKGAWEEYDCAGNTPDQMLEHFNTAVKAGGKECQDQTSKEQKQEPAQNIDDEQKVTTCNGRSMTVKQLRKELKDAGYDGSATDVNAMLAAFQRANIHDPRCADSKTTANKEPVPDQDTSVCPKGICQTCKGEMTIDFLSSQLCNDTVKYPGPCDLSHAADMIQAFNNAAKGTHPNCK